MFCINARDTNVSAKPAHDEWLSEINGAIPLVPVEGHNQDCESRLSSLVPQQLLHGGEHFDGIGRPGVLRRERPYRHVLLPREQLHSYIASIGITRPNVQSAIDVYKQGNEFAHKGIE